MGPSCMRAIAPFLLLALGAPTAPSAPVLPVDGHHFVLSVRGVLDRGNRIVITRAQALWSFEPDAAPQSVEIGGVRWAPAGQPVLANAGASRFLPDDVVLGSARLHVREGRDLVGLEADAGAVTVFVDDTPPGGAEYAFDIEFERLGRAAELTVQARIDGSDVLRIEPARLCWQHRYWDPPADVRVNGIAWDVVGRPERKHELLPADVDLRTARIVARSGRDTVCLRQADGAVELLFADDPDGAADYLVTVRFGP